ncbi:hypothetical protein [Pseudomonas syringae]|uniref:Uncharacterized protein n=1 Tax=Pseudomonas syringae CC1417 TaxID=1357272 RepID=A0AAU8LEU7_PSESX
MKIEKSTVTKLVISDVPRLDPITVFLEDFGRRDCPVENNPGYQTAQGKITISCWDKSWNAYWGGMGPRTVAQFVNSCDAAYVLNCLSRGLDSTRFSGSALKDLAAKCVLERRRHRNMHTWELGSLDADDARELWDRIDELANIENPNECWHHGELLTDLFGDEWHYPVSQHAIEPNHDYDYLLRIVEAVQKALAEPLAEAA